MDDALTPADRARAVDRLRAGLRLIVLTALEDEALYDVALQEARNLRGPQGGPGDGVLLATAVAAAADVLLDVIQELSGELHSNVPTKEAIVGVVWKNIQQSAELLDIEEGLERIAGEFGSDDGSPPATEH
jgi:hypothetical protein